MPTTAGYRLFGVIVSVVWILADDAAIEQAGGINISLWTGLAMLALGSSLLLAFARHRGGCELLLRGAPVAPR